MNVITDNSQKIIVNAVRPFVEAGIISQGEFSELNNFLEKTSSEKAEGKPDCLISMPQMCKTLGLSRPTILGLRKTGKLKGIKVGQRKIYFTQAEFNDFIYNNKEITGR
jgi:excisionase family DNA binding protein